METTTFVPMRARWVIVTACVLALGSPGCSFTTHFDDFRPGDGDDGGGLDSGDTGTLDDGGDAGRRDDGGDAGDSGGDGGTIMHAVHVTLTGAGTGTVTAQPGDLTCTDACTWDVPDGTALTIHAAPDTLSTFAAWGDACGSTDVAEDCMLTITGDVDLSADFGIRDVQLTVVVTNPPGTVTSTTPTDLGIACDGTAAGTCMATLPAGTSVTLSAAPSLPNTQVAWAGATCTGTTCTFDVTDDTTITATFSDGRPVLGVTITGEGSVVADDTRVNCNAGSGDCSEIYDPMTTTTLRATPSVGYTFTSWEGCDSMMGDACTVTLDTSRTVTAHFTQNTYDLTINVTGTAAGMVSSSSPSLTCTAADGTCTLSDIPHGTTISLVEMPVAGARFSSWSGVTGCSTGSMCDFVITADTTATATFVPDTRMVTVAFMGGAGQIFADSNPIDCSVATTGGMPMGTCSATLNVGSTFNLTVIPAAGSTFTGWTSAPVGIGCTGSMSSCAGTVVTAIPGTGGTITAMFTPQRFNLTVVSQAATGGGSVSITPGPTMPTCNASVGGTSCVNNYAFNTMVTLHGMANAGSVFLGWSGGVCAGTSDCVVTMDAVKSVTASFALMTDQLQVNTTGALTGTVTSTTPAGAINCGADCNETVPSGTVVTLMASPAANFVFTGWSGACSGMSATCMVTVSGTTIVNATFVPVQRTLSVMRLGTGSGSVTDDASLAQINCGVDCTGDYDHGTMVTLTANAAVGSTFSGWGGACSASIGATCTLSMTMARSVTATFAPAAATLNVLLSGTGSGRVSSSDAMIDCNLPASGTGGSCSGTYTTPAVITLTAREGSSTALGTWSGCDTVSADGTTCTVNLTAGRTVTMNFDLRRHVVNVSPSPSSFGSVVSMDGRINCGGACGAVYDEGSLVTLTASAIAPNLFQGWTGVPSCSTNPVCTFNVGGPTTAVANFSAPRVLTLRVTGSALTAGSRVLSTGGPSVSCTAPSSGTTTCTYPVPPGTQFMLRGDGQPDYVGPIWSGGPSCTGPDCVFTITTDMTINVSFAPLGNLMFVSSSLHNGSFGTTVATSQTGSNMFCQNLATTAGLPGSYIAWLGYSSSPMTSRIPAADSRWVRTDGRPVATSRTQLFSGALTHPVSMTESGSLLANGTAFTGVNPDGSTPSGLNCSDWTTTTGSGKTGNTGGSGVTWTDSGSGPCTNTQRIICVQTGGSGFAPLAPPAPPPDAVYLWTSSVAVNGSYTIGTMDRVCDDEASMAGLPSGDYVALIGVTGVIATPAITRAMTFGTLVRPDGWPIGPHGMTSSVLANSVTTSTTWSVQYDGTPLSTAPVWTGMNMSASATSTTTCTGWSSGGSTVTGGSGDAISINAITWAGSTTSACNSSRRFYCILGTSGF